MSDPAPALNLGEPGLPCCFSVQPVTTLIRFSVRIFQPGETIYSVDAHDRFRELIARYGAAMRRLCAVYARERHDREDLFQNIFLAVWKALPSYRGDATDRTWVYSIAHNVAVTWRSREERWSRRRRGLEESAQPTEKPTDGRRMQLEGAISRLPPIDRQLVILWLEGFTTAEIAATTGMRPGTVGVRLIRIRRGLVEVFGREENKSG